MTTTTTTTVVVVVVVVVILWVGLDVIFRCKKSHGQNLCSSFNLRR